MRPIPGYRNYLAGEDGQVYRLWHYKQRLETPLPLKAFRNPLGYIQCGAIADADCPPEVGKPRREGRPVHQLICLAFHGLPPSPKHEVDHINRRRDDNRPENLRWVLPDENRRHTNMRRAHGERHHQAKLTREAVDAIRSRRDAGESLKKLSAEFGVSMTTISRIHLGRIWKGKDENAAYSLRLTELSPP